MNLAHVYIQRPDTYVDSYVKIDTSSGLSDLFKLILASNSTLVSNLHAVYGEIWPVLSSSGLAVAESADRYQTTDEAVNATMDDVWKGSGKTTPLDDEATGGEVVDPSESLDEVPESEVEIPDPVHWIMDQAGWLSVSSDVLKVASLFGLDPAAYLVKALGGDYTLVARAGNAAKALAEFERATSATIGAGLGAVTKTWSGNAADAARSYFDIMANAFEAHADQLDVVSNKYEQVAQALAQIATLFASALSFATDKLLVSVAKLAAASCLQEVPVVDVLVDIIGAYAVWVTKEAVDKFIKMCTAVTDVAEAVVGLTIGIAGACEPGTASTAFPKAPYVNGAQS